MPCPRCEAEVDPCARVCPACAMPLAFGDEPAPVPLGRMIALDRRGPARGASSVRPDLALDLDLAPDLDPALDLGLGLGPESSVRPDSSAAGAESKGAHPHRATPSASLHLLASLALDVLLVAAAAALPLAVASSGAIAAPGALAALALPAAGFVALVAAAYVLLSRALLGATPGHLAVARVAGGEPSGSARGRSLDVRAP